MQLTRAAEDRLISVLPTKERNRILKMRQQVTPEELQSAENEVDNWVKEISSIDSKLKKSGNTSCRLQDKPVRGQKRETVVSKPAATSSKRGTAGKPETAKEKKERLSGYDFRAWERFDVDAAEAAVDQEDTAAEKASAEMRAKNKAEAAQLANDVSAKRKELFAREMSELLEKMEVGDLSTVQRSIMAGREKAKGNECFRCGEHQTAFEHYSRSIALDPSVPAYFTNRALVSIKLNKFETAEDDCTRALQLDPKGIKPWWLRASARLHRGRCADAIVDYESALRLEPNNKVVEDMLAKALEKYQEVEGYPYEAVKDPSEKETLLSSRSCVSETTDVMNVATWEGLGVPVNYEVVSTGALRAESAADKSFTRISIQDDDSDDEREQAVASPTRIPITCDDSESDEDEQVEVQEQPELPSGFTRISIADSGSDSEAEAHVVRDLEAAKLALIEQLKADGNAKMQNGDVTGAVDAYTKCYELTMEVNSDVKLAVLNNRSFAYLKMKNYRDAIADASAVLTVEPQNLKALYRRALSYEGCADYESAAADVRLLLATDATNAMGLELSLRLQQHSVPPSPPVDVDEGELVFDRVKHAAMKHMSDGEYDKAISKLEAAVGDGQNPGTATLQQLLMMAYRGTGQDQKVVNCASRIIAKGEDNFRAILCRANAHLTLGDLESAKTDAMSALRIDPTNSEAMALIDQVQEAEELKKIKTPNESKIASSECHSVDAAAESIRLKDAGNEALGKEKFDMAIALYSEAINIDGSNMAALNNRTLAYLKVNKFIDAERDATTLLDWERREGKTPNVKALYRRGLARKNIGSSEALVGALDDFSALLEIEPSNKTAKSEKGKVAQLLSDRKYSSGAVPKPVPVSTVGDSSGFGMTARSTVIKKKDTPKDATIPPPAPAVESSATPVRQPPVTPPTSKPYPSVATPGSSGRRVKEPTVPSEPPRSLYELERTWRGLKFRPDLFAKYVTRFTKVTFKNVFKEAMTPDLLSSILSTIRHEIVATSPETAQRLLSDMTNIGSFSMTIALLPADDLETLRQILLALRVHLGPDSAAVVKLINIYGVTI